LFFESAGYLPVGNTLIAGNFCRSGFAPFGPDVGGPSPNAASITSKNHNLIGLQDGSSGWAVNDLRGSIAAGVIDPVLGPLQFNNGGQTPTMAPLPCSPAIDTGDAMNQPLDQIGQTRPVIVRGISNAGDGSDIGAFELQSFPQIALSIVQDTNNVTISWPAQGTACYLLQESPTLNPPMWVNSTKVVNQTGSLYQVVIPQLVSSNLFFQLLYPN
jgi:hypothetical protein